MVIAVDPQHLDTELEDYICLDKYEVQIARDMLDETVRHANTLRKQVAGKLLELIETGVNCSKM